MKKTFLMFSVIIGIVFGMGAITLAKAQDKLSATQRYEYVGVRYLSGDRVMIVFPDGTPKLLSDLMKYKRPNWADDRIFNLSLAVNYLAKQGYEPIVSPTGNPDKDDVWMRRAVN
jgi:hypothetical protein